MTKMTLKNTKILLINLLIITFLLSSCKSHKNNTIPTENTDVVHTITPGKTSKTQKKLLEEARSWIGTPYAYAKAEKGVGTDCSGMVMSVYETALDKKIPRNSLKQAEFCDRIERDKVEPGDLVFFATGKDPERISHVGIILEDKESFIHASTSKGVCISQLSSPYYTKHLIMFGRVPK
jgi:cell wall-associated NlpC family hydrolase